MEPSLAHPGRRPSERSLLSMMDEAQSRLQNLELSCRQILDPSDVESASNDPQLLQRQVHHLRSQLLAAVARREDEDLAFRQAAQYATAKGSANGVLHALFDQTSSGKIAAIKAYLDTGSIPTRDGLRHWKLDLRTLRNEAGATLLHVAVGVSTARQSNKVKLVHLLVDRVGFDPNVRDVFGQTPLHVAAMSGYQEVVQSLLERGCDPVAQDRSGLTALSLVRTLSRPPEDVVQTLVEAESAAARDQNSKSSLIPLHKAIASALFLKGLSRFGVQLHSSALSRQSTALVNALADVKNGECVPFDQLLQERVPLLFDVVPDCQVTRLDSIFASSIYRDPTFLDDFKVEADSYGLSLISPALITSALAGPTWVGVLLKLIQCLKVEMTEPVSVSADTDLDIQARLAAVSTDSDVIMAEAAQSIQSISPHRKSISTPSYVDSRSNFCYGDQSIFKTRQAWYYAVLFKASTHAFPGTLTVKSESDLILASEDVSKYFPLEDRLVVGAAEYFAIEYDRQTRQIRLDRKYKGNDATNVKAYLTGSCSPLLPPYVSVKRIWEREPGNKYEDQMSSEQELFQDYQFLNPESEYEVAIKLGPIPNGADARSIVADWKRRSKELFDSRE
ncbi:hypothetical protein PHYBOEH_003070 [Phytophthora boehmeriae]|uniref:Ankyrin repeat protein n=1 Tax=Phytophthora boehmeriae TaxID=109152 RepID=A0A8T1WR21_9STRA|nr:hypothetical protein PHYBOEH_003070 [Phytophthora boehmeriae]